MIGVLVMGIALCPAESMGQARVSRTASADVRDVEPSADAWPFEKSPTSGPGAKVSSRLRHLAKEIDARYSTAAASAECPSSLSSPLRSVTDDGMVQCYVAYESDPSAATAAITAAGGIVELISQPLGVVQARIPYDQMDTLAADTAIKRLRLPAYRVARTGSVTSEGDAILRCNQARATWGVSGAGIKVGILSDGITGIGASQASGDIPSTYQAQSAQADGNLFAGSEGLAMMEIVYDLAPGASLAFTNAETSAEMINAIGILDSTFHCNIICDDVAFPDEPFFEDGPIVTRINQATSNGVIYCSAAGNDADQNYYEGDYLGTTHTIGGRSMNVQDFSGKGDWGMQTFVPGNGGYLLLVLQWNDPWGASTNDYDLYLTDSTGSTILASSTDTQNGTGNPVEVVEYTNTRFRDTDVNVVVRQVHGTARHLKIIAWGDGYFTEFYTAAGSIVAHSMADNVLSCGAVPASGPNTIESFSSRGPVRIDFPSLVYRNKPDLCGVDGVSVTGNGGFGSPFFGTSAASPHVAAVCALVWSSNLAMSGSAVRSLVQNSAVDLGSAGYDTTYGYGRADALNAMNSLAPCQAAITILAAPDSGGTVSGGGTYACGANVTATATANTGYTFANWSKDGTPISTSASYPFAAVGNETLVANFTTTSGEFTLTVQAAGNATTTQTYAAGTSATVSAPPAPSGEYFSYWSGDASGSDNPITIVMNTNKTITANYDTCSTQSAPCGTGVPACGLTTIVMLGLMKGGSGRRRTIRAKR